MATPHPSAANWQDLYIVARWDGGATFDSYDGLFTGTTQTGTANGIGIIGHSGSTNLFGTNWFDNLYINGTSSATTGVLGSMSSAFLISASANSTISVTGYRIGVDRTFTSGRDWNGVIAEVVSFNTKLSDSDRQMVEGYLAHKWGLTSSLPSSHPYALGAPTLSSGSPDYITDTPFGSGKAIDLSNGHVEVSTKGNENDFDGGSAFSVSAWVKGWPGKSAGPIITKGAKLPDPSSVPGMKLWLDSSDITTMDMGTSLGASGQPSNGNTIQYWGDKSGNGYHAIKNSGSPTYKSSDFNGGFTCVDTSGDKFSITNSATDFDEWSAMTVAFAFKWTNTNTGDRLVYKGATGWHNNVASYYIGKFNTGAGQGTGFWVADNGTKNKMNGNSYTDARSTEKIFVIKYDGTLSTPNSKFYINGAQVGNHNMNSMFSDLPASSTSPVYVGGAI